MALFIVSFLVFSLAFGGLALGRLLGRDGIRGSCGGLNQPGGCGACGRGPSESAGDCRRKAAS
ncbi:MAG: hypothetical protein WBG86_05050 [Polyangiales bacterium]